MLDRIVVAPPPQAGLLPIDMEDLLVWTYRVQRADVVVARGLGMHRIEAAQDGVAFDAVSSCGCAVVEQIQLLGVRVDGSGGCDALHEDAEAVHEVVLRLDSVLQFLVMRHARSGDRPDAMDGVKPRAFPVLNRKGTTVRHDPTDRARRYGWCPLHWLPSLATIDAARLEYMMWRGALDRLAATLRIEQRLTRHRVTGPTAPILALVHFGA